MNDDANKTELTKDVTAAAIAYFDERGVKPIETEVWVERGWIADVAGVLDPTITELVALRLLPRRPQYNSPQYQEWADLCQRSHRIMTVLVEVKTSLADFRGDRKWTLPQPTNLAYLAIPRDLAIAPDAFPVGWGILLYGSNGLRMSRPAVVKDATVEQQLWVALAVAGRRDNITRYARLRELQRENRERNNERVNLDRQITSLYAMRDIVRGEHGSIDECFARYRLKVHGSFRAEIEKLWGVAKDART